MENFCLISHNNKNFIVLCKGNSLFDLVQALNENKELVSQITHENKEVYSFLIFDDQIKSYIPLTNKTKIENWSKILIKPKYENDISLNNDLTSSNLYELSNETYKKLIANYLNSSDKSLEDNSMISNNSLNFSFTNSSIDLDDSFENKENDGNRNNILVLNNSTLLNSSISKNINNSTLFKNISQQPETDLDNLNNEIQWSEEDILCLLDSCKVFSKDLACFDVSINLDTDTNILFPDENIWKQISTDVQNKTLKNFNNYDCKMKFLNLRLNYKNLMSFMSVKNSCFGRTKYFEQLEQLIDSKRLHIYTTHRVIYPRTEYLALIKQVKMYSRDFRGLKYIVWEKISRNLENQGVKFTSRYCYELFYKLLRKYLDLSETALNLDVAIARWPYFKLFQKIDLTPFSRPQNNYRFFSN